MRRCNILSNWSSRKRGQTEWKIVLFEELIPENYPELITDDNTLNQEAQ